MAAIRFVLSVALPSFERKLVTVSEHVEHPLCALHRFPPLASA
jgi:hypothetical protein